MNTARKAMDCLICFSIVNLMNLLPCQKQLECQILARTGAKGEPVTTPSI